LVVTFINDLTEDQLAELTENTSLCPACFRIDGGEQIRGINVTGVEKISSKRLKLYVNCSGDFSIYTLRLTTRLEGKDMQELFDPLMSAVDFSFKVGCPSPFDCLSEPVFPEEKLPQPEISYLAKDFTSFRQLMLDRLSLLLPEWKERNTADLGMTLVEMLAYLGDQLSYQQDAIATEAYLDTARLRTSVRRHARLVDYTVHDGCNARVWVWVKVSGDTVLPKSTQLFTHVVDPLVILNPGSSEYRDALTRSPQVFETVHGARLLKAHNRLYFYTWGARECSLPKGATRATLAGNLPSLKAGDVLIFQEEGPNPNPVHRQAVRLTHVYSSFDPIGGRFLDPPSDSHIPVTEIEWHPADSLTFTLVLPARGDTGDVDQDGDPVYIKNVSVALGNIILADHGQTLSKVDENEQVVPAPETLDKVPEPRRRQTDGPSNPIPRFRLHLEHTPLVFAMPAAVKPTFSLEFNTNLVDNLNQHKACDSLRKWLDNLPVPWLKNMESIQGAEDDWSLSDGRQAFRVRLETRLPNGAYQYPPASTSIDCMINVYILETSAAQTLAGDPHQALPAICLESLPPDRNSHGDVWEPRRDLLNSTNSDQVYVVEVEADGSANLRFGDDQFGRAPSPGSTFQALYRLGGGTAGNVGAGALAHVLINDPLITNVTNPLPAQGGVAMESIEHVRQNAPFAFRQKERAVTPDDYAAIAMRFPGVQTAAATLRWTSSWPTIFLTIDRVGGLDIDESFENDLRSFMDRYRMAGHDLEIENPIFVPLEVVVHLVVGKGYYRENVEARLLEAFGSRRLPDGRPGFFHPDNFTFGQPVYLSRLYTASQAVPGVAGLIVQKFQRLGDDSSSALDTGKLEMGRLEIARLDIDPNHPERGSFHLV
jgi:hypothetical protein